MTKLRLFFVLILSSLLFLCTLTRNNPYDPKNPDYTPLLPPEDILLTPLSETSVLIEWSDSNKIEDGYVLERSLDGLEWIAIDTTDEDIVSFIDTLDLDTATLYYYRVYSFNQIISRVMDMHAIDSVRTLKAKDSIIAIAPVIYELAVYENSDIRLIWHDTIDNKRGYIIERKVKDDFITIAQTGININSYIDKIDSINILYFYRIAAFNNAGNSPYSKVVSAFISNEFEIDSNTVGLWHMNDLDNDSILTDESSNKFDGVVNGAIPVGGGKFSSCFYFRKGSEIRIHDIKFPNTEFTLEFYFNPASNLNLESPLSGILSVENGPVAIYYDLGLLKIDFFSQTDTVSFSEYRDFNSNKWYLITVSVNQNHKEVYINHIRAFLKENSSSYLSSNNALIYIGKADINNSSVYFSGRIDEIRLLNRALGKIDFF